MKQNAIILAEDLTKILQELEFQVLCFSGDAQAHFSALYGVSSNKI